MGVMGVEPAVHWWGREKSILVSLCGKYGDMSKNSENKVMIFLFWCEISEYYINV